MPSWKKVVASGSDASFSSLTVDTYVSASSFKGSFTGSLEGTASQAISSSYALTASYALFAANGGGGGISAIYIANAGVTQGTASYFDFTGAGVTATVSNNTASINIPGGGGGGGTNSGQTTNFTQSVAATTWTFVHNLNTRTPLVQVYDTSYNQIIPQYVSSSNANTILLTFGIATAGYAVASTGGTIIVTGSNVILNQTAPAATWSFEHNLNYQYPVFQIYGSTDEVIIPERIVATDLTSSLIYFPSPVSGKAVATVGGFSGSSGAGVGFPFSGSAVITGSFLVSQSFVDFSKASYVTGSFTGSLYGSASFATSASYAATASYATNFTASNVLVTGTITAQTLVVQTVTSSIVYSSGSNIFGNDLSNTQTFTGSVNVTGSLTIRGKINSVDSIKFNTSAGVTVGEGELAWNSSDGTLDLGMKGGNVTQQIGEEIFYEIRNETTSSILNGTSLYANGVTAGSGRITAAPFVADGSVREVRYLGLATENISTGVNGFVTNFGYVRGLDTRGTAPSSIAVGDENWSVGDILYAHPIVAGKLTNVKPKHEIIVAIVIIRNQTSGILFVRPSSFGHLEDLHDVNINTGSLSTGDLLIYDSGSDYWVNSKQLSGSYGLTGSLQATSFTGSLYGTASWAENASTASYAYTASSAISASFATFAYSASFAPGFSVSMSQATPALTWSFTHNLNSRNPVVQVYDTTYAQIIPNQIVGMDNSTAEIRFDYAQAGYAVFSNGGGLYVTGSTSTLVQTSANVTWSFTHNLNNKYNTYEVYDSNDTVIIPSGIRAVGDNNAEIYFATPQTGRAVAQFSGINGAPNATSASYAVTATSASYLSPITNSFVVLTQVSQSLNFANDAAAATGGVPLGGLYRSGNFILIRLS